MSGFEPPHVPFGLPNTIPAFFRAPYASLVRWLIRSCSTSAAIVPFANFAPLRFNPILK